MTIYVPPTNEADHKKQNMSLQLIAAQTATNTTNIATNTANIATNTAAIATLNAMRTTSTSLGLVGDGVTDNYALLAAWIASLSNVGGVSLEFAAGTFKFTSPLTFTLLNNAGWSTSSTTSLTIGTGAKTLTVAAGLTISAGQNVTIYNTTAGVQKYMAGTVTSYSGTTLVANITSVSGAGTFTAWDVVQNYLNPNAVSTITITGQGADLTTLYWPTGEGLIFNYDSQQHSIHVRDLSLTTGAANSGKAIKLTNAYPFFGTFNAQSDISDVTCRGSDGYAHVNYWNTGAQITNVENIKFDAFNVAATSSGTVGNGIVFTNPGAGPFTSPVTCGSIYNISNCIFQFCGVGISYGAATQTASVINTQFLQVTSGIVVPASLIGLQGLSVSNCTFFTLGSGIITLTPTPNLFVVGNFFAVPTGFFAVSLLQENTTITGNQFLPRDAANTAAGGIKIDTGTLSSCTTITGNTFSSVGQAIFLTAGTGGAGAGSGGINVQSNCYTGNTGTVLNLGAGNTVGGGST